MKTPDIIFIPSAFKHGISEADIRRAFRTARYDEPVEGEEGKRLLLGFGTATNLLEILYNELDDGAFRVFHAMRCQKKFYSLLSQ